MRRLFLLLLLSVGLVCPAMADMPLLTKPREVRLLDPRYEPIGLIRASFIHTQEETRSDTDPSTGSTVTLDSTKAPASQFGHRQGFVLENVELGMEGRFNDLGLYYKAKFDLVPREKNGNRSDDYLKDAYFGWDRYTVFDVRLGQMKVPMSQANMKSTWKRPFVYSPTLDLLIPKRQLGIRLAGGDPWKIVRLTGGVFNSVSQTGEQLRFLKQLMYVARLDFSLDNLLGAADVALPKTLDFKLRLGAYFGWVEEHFDPETEHRWLGFDAHLHLWRFTVEGEVAFKDFFQEERSDGTQPSDRGFGWHVDLRAVVLPSWLDVVFRIEESDGNKEELGYSTLLTASEATLRKKRWISAGVNVYPLDRTRCNVSYVHRQALEGYELDDDMFMIMCQYAME